MPKLWSETIEAHRREVHDAILDRTVALVGEHGLRGVTMSQIAEEVGIGRATLYKYFADIEAILAASHERQIAHHLGLLAELRDGAADPGEALAAVLEAYALIRHEVGKHHGTDVGALVHQRKHMADAHDRLGRLLSDVLAEGARSGDVRRDVSPAELAIYCIHALGAGGQLPSKAAVRRLVRVTLDALLPDAAGDHPMRPAPAVRGLTEPSAPGSHGGPAHRHDVRPGDEDHHRP